MLVFNKLFRFNTTTTATHLQHTLFLSLHIRSTFNVPFMIVNRVLSVVMYMCMRIAPNQ